MGVIIASSGLAALGPILPVGSETLPHPVQSVPSTAQVGLARLTVLPGSETGLFPVHTAPSQLLAQVRAALASAHSSVVSPTVTPPHAVLQSLLGFRV